MADFLLLILGGVLIILGLIGCVIPVIPGPPLSFIGMIVLHLTSKAQYEPIDLFLWGAIAVVVTILDYIVPIWGTKKFGGSKSGMWGAGIGLVLGLIFFPPLGIIIGPFAGAFIGEAITGKKAEKAFIAGIGSFLGLLMGIMIKLAASIGMTYMFVKEVIATFFQFSS